VVPDSGLQELTRVFTEGFTIVMKAITAHSAGNVRYACSTFRWARGPLRL